MDSEELYVRFLRKLAASNDLAVVEDFVAQQNWPEALRKALHYYGIICVFALGAGAGGICSLHIGLRAIWISSLLLCIAFGMMQKERR